MLRSTLLILFSLIMLNVSATLLWDNPVPVRMGENVEWDRAGTETADGCMIYIWSDTRNGDRDIYARKLSATGADMWGQSLLIVGKPGNQANPVIAKTTNNDFVIAWIDYSVDLYGDVYAQKINASGQILWAAEGVVVCNAPGIQKRLNIEHEIFGGVYIVWADFRIPGSGLYGQALSSQGIVRWLEQGIALTDTIEDERIPTIGSDGNGGLVLGYIHTTEEFRRAYAKGIGYDGIAIWSMMLSQYSLSFQCSNVKMAPIDNTSFVFTWQQGGTPAGIYAQRVTQAGQVMWAAPITVYSNSLGTNSFQQKYPRIVQTNGNSVIIAWEDSRNNPDEEWDIYAQKLNLAGACQWDAQGVVIADAPSNQTDVRLASDNAGGCYAAWEDSRIGNQSDIYVQHLSASGAASWAPNGNSVCAASGNQSDPHIRTINGDVYIAWLDYRADASGLYYQVLNPAGTAQLVADGNPVHTGLYGGASSTSCQLLALTTGTAHIWVETRNPGGYQIFYQITNPDGSPRLEPNGRALTAISALQYEEFQAIVTPADNIIITWTEDERVRVQMLDSNGDRLWGDNGITVSDLLTGRQCMPQVNYEDGAVYVGWSNLIQYNTTEGTVQFYRVYAQKLINGMRMWGDGIMVSQAPDANQHFECILESVTDRYFTWKTFYYTQEHHNSVYVKKLNADGSTAEGWAPQGTAVSTFVDLDLHQENSHSVLTTAGLYVAWEETRNYEPKAIKSQLISPEGNRLWATEGVALGYSQYEQNIGTVTGGNDITICWSDYRVKIQKYSLDGLPLWGETGHFVAPVISNSIQTNPVHCYGNGRYVVSWEVNYNSDTENHWDSDIYYQYINSNGDPATAAPCLLLEAQDNQYKPKLAAHGNVVYISWLDSDRYDVWNRGDDNEYEFYGLFAQKLSNGSETNEDETVPAVNLGLEQNYPNPFNPTTNISFSLKKAAEVELTIYNLKGQVVKTLCKGKLEKGKQNITWNGRDDNDKPCSSGIFFYRLSQGQEQLTRKMVMLK